jgi:hypothetical protein
MNLLGHVASQLGCAGCARGEAGWAAPNSGRSRFPIKKFFFFSNLFCKLQINLNFNDFYSHTKIQEHFITLGKICNGMNATNNYLL